MELVDQWHNEQMQDTELPFEKSLGHIAKLKDELNQIENECSTPEFKQVTDKIVSDHLFFGKLHDLCTSIKMTNPVYSEEYLQKFDELQTTLANLHFVTHNQGSLEQMNDLNDEIETTKKLAVKIRCNQIRNETLAQFTNVVRQMREQLGIVDDSSE